MPEVIWTHCDDPVREAEIERVQSFFRYRFPDDFIETVRLHNGGAPNPRFVTLPGFPPGDPRAKVGLDYLLTLLHDGPDPLIRTAADLYPYLPAGVLPFGGEGAGNYWVFDFRANPEAPTVAFADHESFDPDAGSFDLIPVAASFTELLGMLWSDDAG